MIITIKDIPGIKLADISVGEVFRFKDASEFLNDTRNVAFMKVYPSQYTLCITQASLTNSKQDLVVSLQTGTIYRIPQDAEVFKLNPELILDK